MIDLHDPADLDLARAVATGMENALAQRMGARDAELLAGINTQAEWDRRFLMRWLKRPDSKMHVWLRSQCDQLAQRRGYKLNVLGPRGGAKSAIGCMAYPLRCAVEGWEPLIWIIMETLGQAETQLAKIKRELTDNAALAAAYPGACGVGPLWRSDRVRLRNGVAIEAYGVGQKLRGRGEGENRPSLIIGDDMQSDAVILSHDRRTKNLSWLNSTVLKAGDKRTNFIHLATALHRDAIGHTLDRSPGWVSRNFSAIERWPHRLDLWEAWEAIYHDLDRDDRSEAARIFYEANRAAMDEGAVLLWPEEEDLYTLMCMRAEGGRTAFEREKQGRPVNSDECEWPAEYFGDEMWFEEWPRSLRIKVVSLDPSKGKSDRRGDYSAFVMLGVDQAGTTLYVDADLARRPISLICERAAEVNAEFQPDAFGVEANAFQELLVEPLERAFAATGQLSLPIVGLENTAPKPTRIRKLSPWLAQRRVKFKQGSAGARLLVQQLQDFPLGDHDDAPDALEMALRLALSIDHGQIELNGPVEQIAGELG